MVAGGGASVVYSDTVAARAPSLGSGGRFAGGRVNGWVGGLGDTWGVRLRWHSFFPNS